MVNINKSYTSTKKYDYQLQFKTIIEASKVYTTERFTHNSSMSPGPTMIDKKCSAKKSLHILTEVLGVKIKTYVRLLGADKSNRRSSKAGCMLWSMN